MPLIQNIKAAQLNARKERRLVDASVLTTLIGEAETVGKTNGNRDVTDQEVIAMIKKFIKGIDETIRIAHSYSDSAGADKALIEKKILESFLPKQLSEVELNGAITDIIDAYSTKPNMGQVMKDLKAKYDGLYDGASASKLIKEILV